MSKEEIENEKPDKILEIVEEIVKLNEQKQQGLGLKILTPNQMLIRLPITLAQLKAGNNSEKLKIEIRQLLYSLYRLQKLSILSIYYTWKNIRSKYSNNKFKISAPT